MLQELAEIGMRMARRLDAQQERQAASQPPAAEPPPARAAPTATPIATPVGGDIGLVFSRIARAVRQCIALHAKLHQPQVQATPAGRSWLRSHRPTTIDAEELVQRRERLSAYARSSIIHNAPRRNHEAMFADLTDCLEDEDMEAAILTAPMPDLISEICYDLGIKINYSTWTDQMVDYLAAKARMEESENLHGPPEIHDPYSSEFGPPEFTPPESDQQEFDPPDS